MTTMTAQAELEAFYVRSGQQTPAIAPHLPRMRALAEGLEIAVEFGVKRGASSSALLLGAQTVVSYDVKETPQARELQRIAGERWLYHIEDSRTADVPACDLLFVDSLHNFKQVDAELKAHADKVARYLVFHDVMTFGCVGARGESGEQVWTYRRGEPVPASAVGIRPAIDALMIRDRSWQIAASYTDSHGLLVLERVP